MAGDNGPGESFWALLVGGFFAATAQQGTDQLAVQRYLSAPSLAGCQRGVYLSTALGACLQVLLVLMGVCFWAFYGSGASPSGGGVAPTDPLTDGTLSSSDQILPYFVLTQLPHGVAGLVVAAILGSTMSVFSGGINAATTSIAVDLVGRGHCGWCAGGSSAGAAAPVRHLGRSALRRLTAVTGAVSIGLALLCSQVGGSLVKQSVSVFGLLCSPVLGVTLLGMCSRRVSEAGALAGLGVGLAAMMYLGTAAAVCTGAARGRAACTGGRMTPFWFAPVGCLVTAGTGWALSAAGCCGAAPEARQLAGLTLWTRHERCAATGAEEGAEPLLPTRTAVAPKENADEGAEPLVTRGF